MCWTLHKWNQLGSASPWKLGDTSIYLKITVDYLAAAALDSSARRQWYGEALIILRQQIGTFMEEKFKL